MQRTTITLPDAAFERLNEIVASMKLGSYKVEKWVSDLVVSEVAARLTNQQRSDEPRLLAAARLIFAEHESIANHAPRETLARLEAIAGELQRRPNRVEPQSSVEIRTRYFSW
jgi:hypothetical protein